MRCPEFIKIKTGPYYSEEKPLNDLKIGDKLFLSFGQKRDRETIYEVTSVQDRGEKNKIKETTLLVGIGLTRVKSNFN